MTGYDFMELTDGRNGKRILVKMSAIITVREEKEGTTVCVEGLGDGLCELYILESYDTIRSTTVRVEVERDTKDI